MEEDDETLPGIQGGAHSVFPLHQEIHLRPVRVSQSCIAEPISCTMWGRPNPSTTPKPMKKRTRPMPSSMRPFGGIASSQWTTESSATRRRTSLSTC